LGGGSCGADWRVAQRPGHFAEWIGRDAPFCCFRRSSGNRHIAGALGCGLEWPTWLMGGGRVNDQVSTCGGAHRGVLPYGGRGLGSSAGWLHVPSSFTLLGSPVFSGGSAMVSTSAPDPLTGCPATNPPYATPTSA
jgi:hypothetical protein